MLLDKINNVDITEKRIKNILDNIKTLTHKLKTTEEYKEMLDIIEKINEYRDHYLTIYWCSYIGYLNNIKDEKYLKSEELIGKYDAEYNNLVYLYYNILDEINNKDELKEIFGERLFDIAHNQKILLSNEKTNDYLNEEKELIRDYRKIFMNIQIEYNGENLSLAKSNIYLDNEDRKVRKIINDKRYDAIIDKSEELGNIFLKLVNLRSEYAEQLGFENYKEYGFIKMNRIGYNSEDLRKFKDSVCKYFVPIKNKLREKQKERLNLKKLEYYDNNILFLDGNAKINYDLETLISLLYDELKCISPVFANLFNMMIDEGLIDLSDNEFKSNGGITTYLPKFRVPIFIKKYLGIDDNYSSILHEFGHSLQLFLSRDLRFHENRWPTFDICEIHSTTMELLLLPYASMVFGEDTKKYIIKEFTKLIDIIISCCAIDDFQEYIYSNKINDIEEINEAWKLIQRDYSYEEYDIEYFKRGIGWITDINRVNDPFYGIDYSLASICAISIYNKYLNDKDKTISQYIDLCKLGGQISFRNIVDKYGLSNPFNENDVKKLSKFILEEIEKI